MGYRMLCFLTKKPYTVEHLLGFKSTERTEVLQ